MSVDRFTIVLDRLLPGDPGAGWPAAGALGLADKARAMATERGEADRLADTLAALPADFDDVSEADQIAALKAVEADQPDDFDLLILYAYGVYYTDPRVRDVVETRTGYPNRPPQPEGYELPPFDERLLDKVKQRPPFWRRP